MESLFIILVIVAAVIYVYSLFNKQIYNRKCFLRNKKELEEYTQSYSNVNSNFIYKNRDIEEIIQNYNQKLNPDVCKLFVVKTEKLVKNNICANEKPQIENVISKVLNHMNNCDKTRYKYLDIEAVNIYTSYCGKKLYRVVFHIYETNKFSTRKLIVDYIIDNNSTLKVIKLNTLQSLTDLPKLSGIDIKETKQYEKIDNYDHSSLFPKNRTRNHWINDNEMERLDRMGISANAQEPCKYDLHHWDNASVNTQVKLSKDCKGINHSDRILARQPYVNPTIFQLPLPDEGIIPHTLSMKTE